MEIVFLTWFTGSQMSFQDKVCFKLELFSSTVILGRHLCYLLYSTSFTRSFNEIAVGKWMLFCHFFKLATVLC